MFKVELTYTTKMGNLGANMTTSQLVGSRDDAERVVASLRNIPALSNANITINNAPPTPTIDEAMHGFRLSLRNYPPLEPEAAS